MMKYASLRFLLLLFALFFSAIGVFADDFSLVPDSDLVVAGQKCRIAGDGEGRFAFYSMESQSIISEWFYQIDTYDSMRARDGSLYVPVLNENDEEGLVSLASGQTFGWYSYIGGIAVRSNAGETFVNVFDDEDNEGLLSLETGSVLGWFYDIEEYSVIETQQGRAFVKIYNENDSETLLALDNGNIFDWYNFVDDDVVLHAVSGQTFVRVSDAENLQSMLVLETGEVADWYYYIDHEVVLRSAAGDVYIKVDDPDGNSALLHLQTGSLSGWLPGAHGRTWQIIRNEPCFFGGNGQGQVAFFSIESRQPVTDWYQHIHNTKIVLSGAEYLVAENAAGHFALVDVETGERASDWHEHFIAENATRRLMEAVGNQDTAMIHQVIEDGVDMNSKIIAIIDGYPVVAKPLYFLVGEEGIRDADVEEQEWTKEIFKLFIEAGTNVNGKIVDMREGSLSAFIAAYAFQDPEMIEFMLSKGVDVNEILVFDADGQLGEIPLMFFPVTMEDIEVCRLMIEAGADINMYLAYSEYGKVNETSLLHVAYETGNKELLKLLVDSGADTLRRDSEGMTVLDLATEAYDEEAFGILTGKVE